MVQANVDEALIMDQVVNPIRNGFAISEGQKVIDIDFRTVRKVSRCSIVSS
jgi:sporulation protein YlmC with PRC-barrel domain